MYAIYVAGLVVGVYLVPGLAVLPRAILDSRFAYALPIVSVLLVTTLARILKALGAFDRTAVLLATGTFAVAAAWRLQRLWRGAAGRRPRAHWPAAHRMVYLVSACAMLPAAVRLGLSSFAVDDEIYSWNLWGVQHARGEAADLSFTGAPYPQTFSFLLAWCYHLLGDINLQLPVRAGFALLGVSSIAAIGMAIPRQDAKTIGWFAGLAIVTLFLAGLHAHGLSRGLAEVVMIPALVVSVGLYLHHPRHAESPERRTCVWLASAAAVLAGVAKQPALLWLMITFPALMAIRAARSKRLGDLIPVAAACGAGVLWMVTEGSGFLDNPGVVEASQAGRDWPRQLLHAADAHLAGRPALTALLLLSALAVFGGRRGRGALLGFAAPALLLWFAFAAYSPRNGMHIAAVCALLIAANSFWPLPGRSPAPGVPRSAAAPISARFRRVSHGALAAIVIAAGAVAWHKAHEAGPGLSLYDGGKNTIYRYFGNDAEFVYHDIYRGPDRQPETLWIPSNYIYGIFYGHNPIIRPDAARPPADAHELKVELLRAPPAYVFDAGDRLGDWPAKQALRDLIAQCGSWFEPVAEPPNRFGYTVYRFVPNAAEAGRRCGP